jgi:NADH-quinone oxidoreductase subunit M
VFAALGVILGAVYMLHMVARVIWGPLKTPMVEHDGDDQADLGQAASPGHDDHGNGNSHGHTGGDINRREIAILVPIALAVVLLGFFPNAILKTILPSVQLVQQVEKVTPPRGPVMAAK